ncbi:MAG: hypothetical protein IKF41_01075 [Alphaproteobacteria bacterium]|nr:hypothetical protein [Alphaproteobacteria bacterium]
MLFELARLEYERDMLTSLCSVLNSVYNNALVDLEKFNLNEVSEFDRSHYRNLYRMVYDGACPVKSVPITDDTIKRDLWDCAKCYTVSDINDTLAYTCLVGIPRNQETVISEKTRNALGVHVGDLGGVKLQDNFLSKSLGVLLYDVVFPESLINFGRVPPVVCMRLFNDSRNMINRNGKKYELYDNDGSLILSAEPAKTFFTRRDTAQIKYPRGGIKIFDNPSVIGRREILAELARRYKAKGK